MAGASQMFTPPEFWGFKPFFTIQPVSSTREKQLNCWKSLVLQYCAKGHITRIEPQKFEYFRNDVIDRQLSAEGIQIVVDSLIQASKYENSIELDGSNTNTPTFLILHHHFSFFYC